jgi:hypothetical protein
VGSLGDLVVSGGHDRSLRRWERTEEPFFVEEEKERRLESLFEADLEVGRRMCVCGVRGAAWQTSVWGGGQHSATRQQGAGCGPRGLAAEAGGGGTRWTTHPPGCG